MKKHRWYVGWFCKFLRLRMSPKEVSDFMGIAKSTVWHWSPGPSDKFQKKWAKALPLLGTRPDTVIGSMTGLSKDSIRMRRVKLGVPAFAPPLSMRTKAVRERSNRAKRFAERQVNQELMASWKSP